MGWKGIEQKGIERDSLDYLLTDLLPVELSERFSFYNFYCFLYEKKQQKILQSMILKVKKAKAQNQTILFESNWACQPLKYNILKGEHSFREMSLIQPFAALNIFLFIECFQKDILHYLATHHKFSLRYHKKNNELKYKSTTGDVISYFSKISNTFENKSVIQQAGNYFKIVPFPSINAFTCSHIWEKSNFEYQYFAKIDYKSCFDSIYTHSFCRIIEGNVIDAKSIKSSQLFLTIDRILQNINGRSSNGIVVGPEFSRMIAEILLQHIDNTVLLELQKNHLEYGKHYVVHRYVDDIFIFADEIKTLDLIIDLFKKVAIQYRLNLNELKLLKEETPCLPKEWIEKTRLVSDLISGQFRKKTDSEEEMHLFVPTGQSNRIKDEITVLMKKYASNRRTIVSFLLSTLLNNISKCKRGFKIFNTEKQIAQAIKLLDLVFYIYAFYPSFEQTQKVISILTYINQEVKFVSNDNHLGNGHKKLNLLINKYSFIFKKNNLFDICDWFSIFSQYKLMLPIQIEKTIIDKAKELNDPILWANILIYSQYNEDFHQQIISTVSDIIDKNLAVLDTTEDMEFREFWYVLVFFNCPFLENPLKADFKQLIHKHLKQNSQELPNSLINRLIFDFMNNPTSHHFFDWSNSIDFSKKITYRTFRRTIFKKYKKSYGYYVSLD